MKYVIWGAGRRGRWAKHFLGEDKVVAFVDGDKQKIGQMFSGIRILSFQEASEQYTDCLFVLTPLEASDEIEKFLIEKNFYRYLKLDELPMCIPCDERDEYSIVDNFNMEYRYGLIGVNIFSLYLYEKMLEFNVKVDIAIQSTMNPQLECFLKKHITFTLKEKIERSSDQIVVIKGQEKEIKSKKCISDEEFAINNLLPIRKELLKFRGIHEGKRCFIVATGPSLKVEDLNTLYEHNEICISMNRIYNIFDKTKWRPDYYMVGDIEMIEDLGEDIARLDLPVKFISTEPISYWRRDINSNSVPYKILMRGFVDKMPEFSGCIEKGLCLGSTVTYLCIQLAVYMGVDEIYLIGVDFSYSDNLYDAKNHFEGCETGESRVRLNKVYPERTLLAYKKAALYCEEHGIKIYNATRGGKLEEFERVEFEKLF